MMISSAKTVEEYLGGLLEERSTALKIIRQKILKNLPRGYEEGMQYGMICYFVPLSLYPDGYLGDKKTPLPYVCLASQKNHMAIYLTNIYKDTKNYKWFTEEYKRTGKKMNMGKSCVRFTKLDDLPLELIGQAIGKTSVNEFIKMYESARKR